MYKIVGYGLVAFALIVAGANMMFGPLEAIYSTFKYFLGDHVTVTVLTVIGEFTLYLVCFFIGLSGLALLGRNRSP